MQPILRRLRGRWCATHQRGFLRLDPSGQVRTFPIKGTRPRSDDPVLDEALREQLAADPKERAEHLMVVDLLRNDLGSICSPGSITCGPLFELVAYPGVWHMVTEVRGQLPAGMTRAQLLAATLPAGSITGAPKRAAVQQIHRLERATWSLLRRRGVGHRRRSADRQRHDPHRSLLA